MLAAATVGVALMASVGPARVAGADAGLVEQAEWRPFLADTVGHGHLAVDPAARIGYAFSGTDSSGAVWTRVQALDLETGKALGPVLTIPPVLQNVPIHIDTQRHLVLYPDSAPVTGINVPSTRRLIGLGFRSGQVKQLFSVESPFGALRVAAFGVDAASDDLVVIGTADGTGQSVVTGTNVIEVHRLALGALAAGKVTTRWPQAFRLDPGVCSALIQNNLPPGILVVGDRLYLGCRGTSTFATETAPQTTLGGTSGVVEVTGLGQQRAATVTTRMFRTAGAFSVAGAESTVDLKQRRILLVETGGYNGFRVFDTDHRRYVGRINGGSLQLYGFTVDQTSSRVYFISRDPDIGLGYGDDAALVPTQGERLTTPFAALFGAGGTRRLSFDPVRKRLFIPLRRKNDAGQLVESILVMKDVADPYVAPKAFDHATGTIDAVDREGVTESEQASTARAFGADYQLIGGTANLVQNLTGVDTRGLARPGTRHLRQGYVSSANLTKDGAIAYATVAEEDPTTDLDRHEAGAGDTFAPVASCTDFGAGAQTDTKITATVECNLGKEFVAGHAVYNAQDGVLVTSQGAPAPVQAPIQMGRSSVEVREQRAPNRGPLTTTITAVAENVSIAGLVKFGRVEHVVTLTAHGRSGTAKAERIVKISEVEANGSNLCGSNCSIASVNKQLNTLFDGRFWIDFPAAQITVDPRGTYAELVQDPYVHAERSLDYDKPTDDYVVPAMSVVMLLDGRSKMRLVTDFAGISGTASYRTFPLGHDDPFPTDGPTPTDAPKGGSGGGGTGGGGNAPVVTSGPAPSQPVIADGGSDNPVGALLDRVRLSLRSLGDALPLLLIWALLGIPSYLAARRRLLLELPMLTRDEELT